MIKLKLLMKLILLGSFLFLFSFWLSQHSISFVFSIAAQDYPPNFGMVTVINAHFNIFAVSLNVIVFCLFALFIILGNKLKEKRTRLTASVYSAFIVALFVEMYGLNLSLFMFTWAFGDIFVDNYYNFLWMLTGTDLMLSIFFVFILPISNMMVVVGILLVIFGWSQIYRAKGQLVTTGIYAHIRHPQYLGFLLISLGMIVLWPVTTTLIMWPLILVLYRRLAKDEEKRMEERFGEEYLRYKSTVPRFIPRIRI